MIPDAKTHSPQLLPRACVLSQFPEFCETFVLSELLGLQERGVPLEVFSLKPCRDSQYQPGARELMEHGTHYAPPLRSPRVWLESLRRLMRHPGRWFSTLRLAFAARRGGFEVLLKTLYVFIQAAWFARIAEERGLRHIHAHWASVPSSGGLFIARLSGARFSITAHAYDIFIDRTLLREKLTAADYLVTCTEYNRDFLLKQYPDQAPGKVFVNYHGVDLSAWDQPRDRIRERPVILTVGRLCDTKGYPELIEACRILRERGIAFSCRIVGDGYMRGEIEQRIRNAGLGEHVSILGLLPREGVLEEYRQARVFALPCVVTPRGDRDGLPNVVLEAMATGLPVVTTDISALPEAVVHDKTGVLVKEHDAAGLADAIGALWQDPERRARLGEAARQKVRDKFELQMCLDQLAELTHEKTGGNTKP